MLFTKILVAVDGSRHSLAAAHYARGIARTQMAEIILFHCPGTLPNIIGGEQREDLETILKEKGSELLEPFRLLMNEFDILFTEIVQVGNPANKLIAAAEDNKVDLIVMGSRGLTDLEGLFIGSVTHSVLQNTCCPVLIAR
jgi:nucleotide-binding universal stress UspA family protein